MTKRLRFEVVLSVDEIVPEDRARDALEAMVDDIRQAPNYEDVFIVEDVEIHDEATQRLMETLNNETLNEEDIDTAIDIMEELEDE